MNRKRKILIVATGIALLILLLVPVFKGAEPKYNGVGLSYYLHFRNGNEFRDAIDATKALGPSAVPYLSRMMDRQPLTELLMALSQHWPLRYLKSVPTQSEYLNRRIRASALLKVLGTNAFASLPNALKIVESEGALSPPR